MSRSFAAAIALSVLVLTVTAPAGAASDNQQQLVRHYVTIQTALAAGSARGVAEIAKHMADLSRSVASEGVNTDVMAALATTAMNLGSEDVEQVRAGFEPFTRAMFSFLVASNQQGALALYGCAEDHHHWLQLPGPAHNPYRDSGQPACGAPASGFDS